MMSERLFEFDTEGELMEAFGSFDDDDSGTVRVDEMRRWLGEVGERMTEQEVRGVTDCHRIHTDGAADGTAAHGPVHGSRGEFQLSGVGQGAARGLVVAVPRMPSSDLRARSVAWRRETPRAPRR